MENPIICCVGPVPEVGKQYYFFDDGKIRPSRGYIATCVKVVPFSEAKNILFDITEREGTDETFIHTENSLEEIWDVEVKDCDWIFDPVTDYFVCCKIPGYDENEIWFARHKGYGWFSLNIQNWWQGGLLDTESRYYNERMKEEGSEYWGLLKIKETI